MDGKMNLNNNRGQIAIWIIIAVIIVGTLTVAFIFSPKIDVVSRQSFSPQGFLDKCVRDSVQEVENIILPKGGFVDNKNNVFFRGINVSYLCYNSGNYLPCINQHPVYISELNEEIKSYIEPEVEKCFEDLEDEVVRKGGTSELGELDIEVKLTIGRIFVKLDRVANFDFGGQTTRFEDFEIELLSPLYGLGIVAMEIASQEARYCHFSYDGYSILHPRFDIRKTVLSDSNDVYSIEDKKSGKILNIAIRGCAIPPAI